MVTARSCTVSFCDETGVRHEVDVIAESVYEAALLGVKAIRQNSSADPEPLAPIDVQVKLPTVQQTVAMKQVREWLSGTSRHPSERALKERLRLLAM